MKYTPGPWSVGRTLTGGCLPVNQALAGDRMQVARVNGAAGEQDANARLIAAAPDLLDALRECLAALDGSGHACVSTARAAIAKAVRP